MKIYISHDTGNLFWLKNDVLMACPLHKDDGLIDLEKESCEVDLPFLDNETDDEIELRHKIEKELEN